MHFQIELFTTNILGALSSKSFTMTKVKILQVASVSRVRLGNCHGFLWFI